MRNLNTQVVVIGSGPGGYSAAFRAADLNKKVVIVEAADNIGGVCLNVGCIPSKALLHAAKILDDTQHLATNKIFTNVPKVDIDKLCDWKNSIVKRLETGLRSLAKQRKIEIIPGYGKFVSANELEVTTKTETVKITFENAIIAVGSSPVTLPFLPNDPRVMDSTIALNLIDVPNELLILGGGIIGLEMANIYHALGSKITVVELMDQLIPDTDADIVKPLQQFIAKQYQKILLKTKVVDVAAKTDGLWVTFAGADNAATTTQRFDKILVAIGRKPNGKLIGAEHANVFVDGKGFIPVDKEMRTNIPHIFAIGDVVGNPMLAHKASHEGHAVAEVIAGLPMPKISHNIPGVAYTDPEIATVGLKEKEAVLNGIKYGKGIYPWLACGRSLTLGRTEGLTKLLFDPTSNKILGGSIVGPHAGELIAEIALAIALGATAEDIAHTIHPHPSLSETTMLATEAFLGTVTDIYIKKPS
jgi:dihydrolipoamide dehydrogenase